MIYRIRDIVIASIAGFLLSPLIGIIILLLWLTQPKVFFIQQRPGLNEKPFSLIKFSTLFDALPGEDETSNQLQRLTPIGKYLRRWSLDELPQLLNVLKGEMSLVGPRPLLMEYLPLYTEKERLRHSVRPGITGWAQIHGRNILSFKQKFAYDVWYVGNRSFWLDARILFMTFGKVISAEGVTVDDNNTAPRYNGRN